MALSKIYQQRLEQLHEDIDRSINKKISESNIDKLNALKKEYEEEFLFDIVDMFIKNNLPLEGKIELLTKLEEL